MYGTVCHSMLQYGTVHYGTVFYGTVQHGTVWYGTVQYGMVCNVFLQCSMYSVYPVSAGGSQPGPAVQQGGGNEFIFPGHISDLGVVCYGMVLSYF